MGIHRNVTVNFEYRPEVHTLGGEPTDEQHNEIIKRVCAALRQQSGYENNSWGDETYFFVDDCNWYDFAEDIAQVSLEFPFLRFEADIEDGDGSQASFTAYEGKGHLRWGEMVFPEFEESRMETLAESED